MDKAMVEKVFRALGDRHRLAILDLLKVQPQNGGQLLEKVDVVQSTLSHHMKTLCESGVVTARKDGKWTVYSVNEEQLAEAGKFLALYIGKSADLSEDEKTTDMTRGKTADAGHKKAAGKPQGKKVNAADEPQGKKVNAADEPRDKKAGAAGERATDKPRNTKADEAEEIAGAEEITYPDFPSANAGETASDQKKPPKAKKAAKEKKEEEPETGAKEKKQEKKKKAEAKGKEKEKAEAKGKEKEKALKKAEKKKEKGKHKGR